MAFRVIHGGFIRYSAVVAAANTTYWTKGRLLSLNSSGQIIIHVGLKSTNPNVGVAMENRINPSNVGPTTTLNKISAPTGETNSMVMDDAVIQMEQNLESGVTFTAGALLYASTNGKVTTSGSTTGPGPNQILGCALTGANSGDPNQQLTWLFKATY